MDFAKKIDGILEGTECKNCPWYKHCVIPVPDALDVLARMPQGMMQGMSQGMMQEIWPVIQEMQKTIIISCPIFAKRLKESPRLVESIRKIMQEWDES